MELGHCLTYSVCVCIQYVFQDDLSISSSVYAFTAWCICMAVFVSVWICMFTVLYISSEMVAHLGLYMSSTPTNPAVVTLLSQKWAL